jgi:hypothetical protein
VGRAFRRGGKYSMQSQPIIDFYEYYNKYKEEYNSDDEKRKDASKKYWDLI